MAAKEGNHAILDRLIAEECDMTDKDDDVQRQTALQDAAAAGDVKFVQQILKVLEEKNKPLFDDHSCNDDLLRAFHLAVFFGHLDVVDVFLAIGASASEEVFWDHNSVISEYFSGVYWPVEWMKNLFSASVIAAGRGDVPALRAMDQNATLASAAPSPLRFAAAVGQIEALKYLLPRSSNPAVSEAAWAAAREGQLEALDLILAHATRDKTSNSLGGSKPRCIIDTKYLPSSTFFDNILSDAGADTERVSRTLRAVGRVVQTWPKRLKIVWKTRRDFLLIQALHRRHLACVEACIADGADPNFELKGSNNKMLRHSMDLMERVMRAVRAAYPRGRPPTPRPVYLAIYNDLPEALGVMFNRESKLNGVCDPSLGWTPLHIAAILDKPAAVRQLLTMGAKSDPKTAGTEYGCQSTPLHFARSAEMVKTLLDSGANINARDAYMLTPLHRLMDLNSIGKDAYIDAMHAMVAGGGALNAVDRWGNTPLHRACATYPDSKMVEALLDAGADPSLRDYSFRTSLEVIDRPVPIRGSHTSLKIRWVHFGPVQIHVAGLLLANFPGGWKVLPQGLGPKWALVLGPVWRRAPQDYRLACSLMVERPLDLQKVYEWSDEEMREVMKATAEGLVRWLPDGKFPLEVRRRVLEAMFAASPYDY